MFRARLVGTCTCVCVSVISKWAKGPLIWLPAHNVPGSQNQSPVSVFGVVSNASSMCVCVSAHREKMWDFY